MNMDQIRIKAVDMVIINSLVFSAVLHTRFDKKKILESYYINYFPAEIIVNYLKLFELTFAPMKGLKIAKSILKMYELFTM